MKTALISFSLAFFLALSLCASVAYAWVYQTEKAFAVQRRAQQAELERVKAAAEQRIAAEVALREALQLAAARPQAVPAAPGQPANKDEAWSKWYQPPEQCGMNVAEADFVDCVNHKMLARKTFERVWQSGMN